MNKNNFTFSNLGSWRKFYLVFRWSIVALITPVTIYHGVTDNTVSLGVALGLSAYLIGLSLWTHKATAARDVGSLYLIALFSLLSPLSALIILLIAFASKREIAAQQG